MTCVFGAITEAQCQEAVDLWVRNGAMKTAELARQRCGQVCWMVRDPAGTLVALSTLYVQPYGPEQIPYHWFRSFIEEGSRRAHLAFILVGLTRKLLVERHRPGQLEAGLVIETQNRGLMTEPARQIFRDWGWTYDGTSPGGFDLWRLDNAQLDLTLPEGVVVTG